MFPKHCQNINKNCYWKNNIK